MCETCLGSGAIIRPIKTIEARISRRVYEGERVDCIDDFDTVTVGGVDACPTCTAVAEADRMARRGVSAGVECEMIGRWGLSWGVVVAGKS